MCCPPRALAALLTGYSTGTETPLCVYVCVCVCVCVSASAPTGRQLSNPALRFPPSPNPSSLNPSRQGSQRPLSPGGGGLSGGRLLAAPNDIRISDVQLNLVTTAGAGHGSVGIGGGGSGSHSVFRTTGNNIRGLVATGGGGGGGSVSASSATEATPASMAAAGYGIRGGGGDGGDAAGGTGSVVDPAEDEQQYHEITATSFLDPVSKAQVVMVVQTVSQCRAACLTTFIGHRRSVGTVCGPVVMSGLKPATIAIFPNPVTFSSVSRHTAHATREP